MKRIALMPNPYRDRGFQNALAAEQILRQKGALTSMCLPFHVDRNFELPSHIRFIPLEQALTGCDLMICFGGDGTILHAAKISTARDIPMLGINTGTMGFMAELESNELHLLGRLLTGNYTVDARMMLHVAVRRGGNLLYEDDALNDAVITKGAVARVIQMTVLCDRVEAMQFDGDGVILCTPTGSTAYSMSAGGPIVEPSAQNIIVTPICAHALHVRSFVLARNRVATVQIGRIGRRNAYLSVDGGKAFRLNADDQVIVSESTKQTKLVRLKNTSFYEIINTKFQER